MKKKKLGKDSPDIINDDGYLGEVLNDIEKARIEAEKADKMGLNVDEASSNLDHKISKLIDPDALS